MRKGATIYNQHLHTPERQYAFDKWVNESFNLIKEMELAIYNLAKRGKRDINMEQQMWRETDYYLQLTAKP